MARPPIGKKAMTPAERQRRRRKRLKKEKAALGCRAENQRRRLKAAKTYMPMPPGITYWRTVKVKTADGQVIETAVPLTKLLPSLEVGELDNADIIALLRQLTRAAIARGLLTPGEPVPVAPLDAAGPTVASLLQAASTRELEPGEGCTIGPAP
jgi:hypothetical protein